MRLSKERRYGCQKGGWVGGCGGHNIILDQRFQDTRERNIKQKNGMLGNRRRSVSGRGSDKRLGNKEGETRKLEERQGGELQSKTGHRFYFIAPSGPAAYWS